MKLRELVNVASYGTEYSIYINGCYKGNYIGAYKIPDKWLSHTVADIEAHMFELKVSLKPDEIVWWK